MDNATDKVSYSRSDLLSLRFEGSARQRPNCANQEELHALNFWKINGLPSNLINSQSNSNSYGNKACLSPDRDRERDRDNLSLSNSSNGLLSSRRALRNRERAHNYYQRFSLSDQIGGDGDLGRSGLGVMTSASGNIGTSYCKSSNIDHRSISSSHLMPAFAKRRFVIESGGSNDASSENNNKTESNEKSKSLTPYDDEGPPNLKDCMSNANAELKTHLKHSSNLLGSPLRNNVSNVVSAEWERNEKLSYNQTDNEPQHQSLTLSPTLISIRQGVTGGGSSNTQERRIGSGRLFPRNDNWEFKNQNTESSVPLTGNNIANQQRHRTFSGKHSERSNDQLGDRDRERDKRLIERTSRGDHRDQHDGKKNIQGGGRRAYHNKDKFNFIDSVNQNHHKGKRFQAHDSHEPEWFSAGPTSQHETIDLHGFDDMEGDVVNRKANDNEGSTSKHINSKSQIQIETTTTIKNITTSRSSSIASLNRIDSNDYKRDSDERTSKVTSKSSHISKSEVEFNFDAFLNMDPLDHSLMGSDGDVQGELTGTSRFSRWFAPKEPGSNNEQVTFEESSTLDTHGKHEIPSVKDLEAQMTKVDLRPEHTMDMANPMTSAQQPIPTEQSENSTTRDTEAFKKLLQQLGSCQNNVQAVPQPYLTNISAVRSGPGSISGLGSVPSTTTAHDCYQHVVRGQDSQLRKDDIQSYQQQPQPQHTVKSDSMPYNSRHNEAILNSQLHPAFISCVHDPNMLGHLPLQQQTQKRIEVQHLFQSVIRGDVSFEFLEKELNNPTTSAQSREIIATVLFECSNSGRNVIQPVQQKPLAYHPNDLNHPHANATKNYPLFNKNIGSSVSDDLFSSVSNQVMGHHQNLRHTNSPTPLAFTPTSVLRKMTADKETTALHNTSSAMNHQQQQQYQQHQQQQQQQYHSKLSAVHNMINDSSVITAGINLQPRMILGGNYAIQNQLNLNSPQISPKLLPQMSQSRGQQQVKWPTASGSMLSAHGAKSSYGRPILKGTLNSGSQQINPLTISSNNDLQQIHQQRVKSLQQPTETINNESSMHGGPTLIHNVAYNDGVSQMQHHIYLQHQQQQSRHRLIHGDLHRQTNIPVHSSIPNTASGPESESTGIMKNNRLSPMIYHRDDRLSPTSNQLAQWFSPELLARASAGKLPLLNMNQTLSLEEFERNIQHSSATVLN